MGHLLTAEERKRFVEYCEEESYSYSQIVDVMKEAKLNTMVIAEKLKLALAYAIVAEHLKDTGESTVGKDGT